MTTIYGELLKMKQCLEKSNINDIYTKLQTIREKLVQIFKYNGTKSMEDILNLYYGSDYIKKFCLNKENKEKYDIINQFCHPISYINLTWKEHNKPVENAKIIAWSCGAQKIQDGEGAKNKR